MDLRQLAFLQSDRARGALERLAGQALGPGRELQLLSGLRREHAPEEAAALLTLARLRRRALEKFPQAERMFFEAEALEQATAHPLAEARAERIHRHAPPGAILELGAGLGGDTLCLARRRPVIAFERDQIRAAILEANLRALGLLEQVTIRLEDGIGPDLPQAAALFADPARRRGGRRLFSLEACDPPLSRLLELRARIPELVIKAAPGVQDEELPEGCSLDFVGPAGECREATLWFGRLAGPPRRARVWRAGAWESLTASGAPPPTGPLRPGQVLYELEPAVVRAGALWEMCQRLEAWLFDPRVAWLVGDRLREDPLARGFMIEEIHPFRLKTVQARLRALGISRLEIKTRAIALDPEALRRRLRLPAGGRDGVLLLTRAGEDPLALVGSRLPGSGR